MKPFFVYLLRCADGSYCPGHTDDLAARIERHSAGRTGHTALRQPVTLLWQGEFEKREEALAFEQQIKGWSRAKKAALVAGNWAEIRRLAKSGRPSGRPCAQSALRQAQGERWRGAA